MSSAETPAQIPAQADPELDLKIKQDQHQFEYAMAALAAQERDRERDRDHTRRCMKGSIWFTVAFCIVILIITLSAFYYNKEQFIVDCLNYLAVFCGGGGIGYGIGLKKRDHGKIDIP